MLPIFTSEDSDGASCVCLRVPTRRLPSTFSRAALAYGLVPRSRLPPQEERQKAAGSPVCSSLAAQTTAPPVVSLPLLRQGEGQHLRLCGPGVRSKAAEEPPNTM